MLLPPTFGVVQFPSLSSDRCPSTNGFRCQVSGVSPAAGCVSTSLIKKRKFSNVGSASAPTYNGGHGLRRTQPSRGPSNISGRNEFSYDPIPFPTHLLTFSPSHLLLFSPSHLLIFLSFYLPTFSSSYLFTFPAFKLPSLPAFFLCPRFSVFCHPS